MELGDFELCLQVKDVKRSSDFYKKLGFSEEKLNEGEGWAYLSKDGFMLALYSSIHISENLMNFRGGDVFKNSQELKRRGIDFESDAKVESDGSSGAFIRDPDGNLIYLNTHPSEI